MDESAPEEVLEGGQLSRVVRIGDTVRRPAGAWTPAVHALLRHLEAKGFPGAPRALGLDDQGREVLTYVEGRTVGAEQPWPDWVWTDAVLEKTGRWLRLYHEAVRDFVEPLEAIWRMHWTAQRGPEEVICHFDVAPYNLVLGAQGDVTLIDWDVAAPGVPILDLAKAANAFSPVYDVATRTALGHRSGELVRPIRDRWIERTRLVLNAYGQGDRNEFVAWMIDACTHSYTRIHRGAHEGDTALRRLLAAGIDHVIETRELLIQHHDEIQSGILD